jgi:hypothetical protein
VTDVRLAFLGVGLSGLLWLIGIRWHLALQASLVQTLPADWKAQAPDDYALLTAVRLRDVVRESTDVVRLLAATLALFALLEVFDVLVGLQLGLGIVIAAYWAGSTISAGIAEQEGYRLAHNLARLCATLARVGVLRIDLYDLPGSGASRFLPRAMCRSAHLIGAWDASFARGRRGRAALALPLAGTGDSAQGSIQGANLSVSESNSDELKATETNSEELKATRIGW